MKKNFVSILITNYNKGKYLKKTINSCLIQDYKDKEVLVFDDCSTDNSLKILKKCKNITVIKNKKKNLKVLLSIKFMVYVSFLRYQKEILYFY